MWRDVHFSSQGEEKKRTRQTNARIYKPSIGEIVFVADEGADTRKGKWTYPFPYPWERIAYFLSLSSDGFGNVQLSGSPGPQRVPVDRIRPCRGAAVLVPGPVKTYVGISG